MFKKLISPNSGLSKLLVSLEGGKNVTVFGTGINEQILILNQLSGTKLIVCATVDECISVYETLVGEGKNVGLLTQRLSFNPSFFNVQANFLNTLSNLCLNLYDFVVASPECLITKLPQKQSILNSILNLEVGKQFNLSGLIKTLIKMGYKRQEGVFNELDFSVKGDIVNIFPINCEHPIKISFFDNEIEFIKSFDINTQNIIDSLNNIQIFSTQFVLENNLNVPSLNRFDQVTDMLNKGIFPYFAHVFTSDFSTKLYEYGFDFVVFKDPKQILDKLNKHYTELSAEFKELLASGDVLKEHQNFYFNLAEVFDFKNTSASLISFQSIANQNNIFKTDATFNLNVLPQLNYTFNQKTLFEDVKRLSLNSNTVLIFAGNLELAEKLNSSFLNLNINSKTCLGLSKAQSAMVNIIAKQSQLSGGFKEEKLIFIGFKQPKKVLNNKTTSFDTFLPVEGDLVVHNSYGIGKCLGIKSLSVNNLTKDYIEIEYKNNDKLFLPVENIDTISKYVGGDKPKLNKLGSQEFLKAKQKVKDSIKKITINLKQLYAERLNTVGITFPADDPIQELFESSCPFVLTADQDRAVKDVKADMQSPKAMDRLVCGDVGFGKTEVALRAIYKAVMAGYQVMLLCPTTILSEQHYNTINERMGSFGVVAKNLNRFKSAAETKQILEDLSLGKIDVICGTHKLLGNQVKPKNLGLLVLDEEQRFGVEHKEKIKKFKANIDVLTLSATPIPRTMHSALIGVKDISVIETAPTGRVPVMANVYNSNDQIVLNAINRELSRNGQVLIVYNRVETIYSYAEHIKKLINNDQVVIDIAHGQMSEKLLEDSILNLYNGKTNILISTTLIENGVDLPNANTLIVNSSDMLGLSQLYQLKGRIGRGNRQAYALFLVDSNKVISEDANKRLSAIIEYSGLGNGFKIAMRDLEIRGAGSLFGAEQSGHIENIGYNMYVNLLNEAVKEIKGEKVKVLSDVKMNCYFEANLPNYYVSNTNLRMQIYTDIAKINSEQSQQEYLNTLKFAYGDVPEELNNLIYVARIKNLASENNIEKINIGYNLTKITFNSSSAEILNKLSQAILNWGQEVVLSLENLPIISIKTTGNLNSTITKVINFLNSVNK